jgi:adenylate cyclase
LLAYHWEQAGEALTAAQWHARAAGIAGLGSPAEALRHWEKVWEILQPAASSEEAVALRLRAASELLILGFRQGMPAERVDEIFTEAKALAVARGDVREQVRLLYGVTVHHMLSGAPRRAIPYAEENVSLADSTGEVELRWAAREPFEFALLQLGDLNQALRINDEQVAFSRADPAVGTAMIGFTTSNTFAHRGWILMDLGRFDEGVAALQRAEELARRFDDGEILSWNDTFRCRLYERAGDAQSALSTGRRAIESAEKIGSGLARVIAHGAYGAALGLTAKWETARQSLELALEIARANRVALFMEADFVAALAEAQLGLGEAARARELVEEAIAIALRMEMRIAETRAQLARARVLLALDGAAAREQVEASLDRALALVRSTGARSYEPQIHVERARLAGVLSDPAGHDEWRREAKRLFTELGATGHAERVAALLGQAPR